VAWSRGGTAKKSKGNNKIGSFGGKSSPWKRTTLKKLPRKGKRQKVGGSVQNLQGGKNGFGGGGGWGIEGGEVESPIPQGPERMTTIPIKRKKGREIKGESPWVGEKLSDIRNCLEK